MICPEKYRHGARGDFKNSPMPELEAPTRDQTLYEKSEYLRVYSGALLTEAQELCKVSQDLRKATAKITSELQVIRAVGFPVNPANRLIYADMIKVSK